jgi:spermidine synthase
MRSLLWLCFGLSGAAAVALEMLWMRSAGLVLGTTAITAATVLACYFTGLALGSIAARRGSSRPVRCYGQLELSAAAGALWSLFVFYILQQESMQTSFLTAGLIPRTLIVVLAILPTTICLGATLPILGQALTRPEAVGPRGGLLYAINTAGGVLGAAAAGLGLPMMIGVRLSYGIAAALSALAGTLAMIIGDPQQVREIESKKEIEACSSERTRLRLVAAGAGALALGLEVLWTHLFAQVLHNSVYSFTAIVIVFLLAIATGAAMASYLLRRVSPTILAITALLAGSATTVAGLWIFVYLTNGLEYFGMRSGLFEYLIRVTSLAALTVGPVAIASGVVLPALWAAWGEKKNVAHPLGALTAANLLGGVLGAVVTGFLVIPSLGIRAGLLVTAVIYIVLADLLASTQTRLRPIAYAILLLVVIANPMRVPLVHLNSENETLRSTSEGPAGIVTVVEGNNDLQLRLDNYYVLGRSAAAATEHRQGLIPLLLHPDPKRAAFVGLATGISASAGPALGVEQTTVIELVPEVAAAARRYFGRWNGNLLERSNVRLVIEDGRRYLTASRDRFDVIVSDLFVPWNPGTGNLYAREMYEAAARRLEPDGIFCQWLPLYQLTYEEFKIIARTLLTVFSEVSLWRADFYAELPVVGLVGRLTPQSLDVAKVRERAARLPEWGNDSLLSTRRGLVMLYGGNLRAAADIFDDAPITSDDHPLIEFLAPRFTRVAATFKNPDWFTGQRLAAFYDNIEKRSAGAPDPFFADSKELYDARRAGTALYHYAVAAAQHDDTTAARYQKEVRDLVPEVVSAAGSTRSTSANEKSEAALAELLKQQERLRQQLEEMHRRLNELSR